MGNLRENDWKELTMSRKNVGPDSGAEAEVIGSKCSNQNQSDRPETVLQDSVYDRRNL